MRGRLPVFALLSLASALCGPLASGAPTPTPVSSSSPAAHAPSHLEQRAAERLQALVPSAPPTALATAAARFADEAISKQPALSSDREADAFVLSQAESALLRAAASELRASNFDSLRDELAVKRVAALVTAQEKKTCTPEEAAGLVQKLKSTSSVYHTRLRDGKMDDDDLWSMIRKIKAGPAEQKKVAIARESSGGDLLADYARKNQEGTASNRMRAYVMDCELRTSNGDVQRLVIARQRPDHFRLHAYQGSKLEMVLAGDRDSVAKWSRGQTPTRARQDDAATADFLCTFIEPCLEPDTLQAAKAGEEKVGERLATKLVVSQPVPARRWTVWIDKENGQMLKRETEEGTRIVYSDFRDIAGVKWPHRVETTDAKNRSSVLTIRRFAVNPGILSDLFEVKDTPVFDIFAFDTLAASKRPELRLSKP